MDGGYNELDEIISWPRDAFWSSNDVLAAAYQLNDVMANTTTKELPVSKWTSVSEDDNLLTHLLNLFWTWDNTINNAICRDIFIDDLKQGAEIGEDIDTIRTECCSPFLVNAILAAACVGFYGPLQYLHVHCSYQPCK